MGDYTMARKGRKKADQAERKMLMQMQRQQEREINLAWIDLMSKDNGQLREKMALFWNNHFACRSKQPLHAQQLVNMQRQHALGNFKTLTLAIAKSPAMLQFLNNQQNLKGHPNENFARELMELFTIGRGNYTEQDVKESARAFTGWGYDQSGEFRFRPAAHDDDRKTFLGKSGNFTGEDIINSLFDKKETARFISTKLYKYLVNETPDTAHINVMSDVFYKANYEIKPLLEYIFTAEWFYEDKNIGNLVKSPVELIVGLNRQFDIAYQKPAILLQFQKVLGQVLLYPPNVAGWPGGRNWIDSSSLMYRIKIPSTLLNGGMIDFNGKADPEDEAFLATAKVMKEAAGTRVQAHANWNKFLGSIPPSLDNKSLAQFMLQPTISNALTKTVAQAKDKKALVIELVSSPEYQLS
ncbi:DUF1800 domain-containing protein [Mucilaginibacter antarcticus]|uniref:DUF1800 domain-containing protein n=1 Tax=Mucilaginibacter antarcticus TaxID=1855725 RepID=UPI00364595E6